MPYTDTFSFYRSAEWSKFRKAFLMTRMARDGELICEHCGKVIIHPYDAILHHSIELDDRNVHDAEISLNGEHIMLVCHACHNKIHDRWQGGSGSGSGSRHVYVVWGSPCAGKRAYVERSASKYDLIVDIDRLYECVTVGAYRGSVKGNVMALYRSLIDMVKTRNGRWKSAWIIRTLPLEIDRDSLMREIGGAESIHIDTDHDSCLIEAQRRGREWVDWVEQYWSKYQPPSL